eukprot:TRINITY_DN5432_c0_g1_i2.p1 TRINITY_DN5432_c0_g1~~TRINITY_DN5432_c0_g1_i2.p1  ORF type:complete len:329 (+),score=62.31 TRINITY_DN5432_c0_g1_i2:20-1006(+)
MKRGATVGVMNFDEFVVDIRNLILCCLEPVDLINFGYTNHYYHSLIFTLEKKWGELDFKSNEGWNEEFFLKNVGKFAHTIKLGSLSPEKVSKIWPLLGHFCPQLDLLIIKTIKSPTSNHFLDLSKHCPNLTGLEVHEDMDDIGDISFLFDKFPKLTHLILHRSNNFLHTQWDPRTLRAVLPLLEDQFRSSLHDDLKREELFQSWITLQFLYKKLKDPKSAERVVGEYKASGRPRPGVVEDVLKMDERILSLRCSRPLDRNTCYYWNLCFTCGLHGFSGLCAHCVEHCHKGHKTVFKYISSGAYCDCTHQHPTDPNEQEQHSDQSSSEE